MPTHCAGNRVAVLQKIRCEAILTPPGKALRGGWHGVLCGTCQTCSVGWEGGSHTEWKKPLSSLRLDLTAQRVIPDCEMQSVGCPDVGSRVGRGVPFSRHLLSTKAAVPLTSKDLHTLLPVVASPGHKTHVGPHSWEKKRVGEPDDLLGESYLIPFHSILHSLSVCLYVPPPLSLSLFHTHTHTHTPPHKPS